MTGSAPDPATHDGPAAFMCGSGLRGCVVGYVRKPEKVLASQLCEDLSDWLTALRGARGHDIPAGVVSAMESAVLAASNWLEWIERTERR